MVIAVVGLEASGTQESRCTSVDSTGWCLMHTEFLWYQNSEVTSLESGQSAVKEALGLGQGQAWSWEIKVTTRTFMML